MKKLYAAALFIILSAVTMLSAPYALNIKDFTALKVNDGINVVYKSVPDSAGWIVFDTEETMAPKILFSNDKNTLKIELANDDQPISNLPTIHVYSSVLTKAENSKDSTLTVISPTPAASIELRIIGNGTIIAKNIHATQVKGRIDTGSGHLVINGKAKKAEFYNTGTGRIEGSGLKAEVGRCQLLGTGSIDCAISEELTVIGAGSGTIYLEGKPKIKKRALGVKIVQTEE